MPTRVSQIFLYPVKSLRGFAVRKAVIDPLGFAGDRRFLVVDPAGSFLTQRSVPLMATVETALGPDWLMLRTETMGSVRVPLATLPKEAPVIRRVTVWQSTGLEAEDCGETIAAWLTDVLQTPARLVRAGPAFRRTVPERKLPALLRRFPEAAPEAESARTVAFPDAYPFMVLGEASLDELNGRLQAQGDPTLPIERFRPSFVVTGSEPFAEDSWKRFRIADVTFFGGGPCARCIMTNTDPWTGERGIEPLRLLSTYRRDPVTGTKVHFGQNALHDGDRGTIRVEDSLTVLESQA